VRVHPWCKCLPIIASLVLGACSPMAGLDPLPASASTQYLLDAGDELRVTAYGLDGFSSTYVISDMGTVSLPLIGDVPASGKTADQVQQAIARQLTEKRIVNAPIVNVQVNEYRHFFIVGEIKKPGEYPFRPGTSVLNAISMAGGYTFRAQTKKVAITRRKGNSSFTAVATEQAFIQPGDTIRVYESWF
jgi:polysaccharide export outer membrane protein